MLKELNDAVTGSFVEEEPAQLIRENPAYFKDFTIVIATQARSQAVHRAFVRVSRVLVSPLCRVVSLGSECESSFRQLSLACQPAHSPSAGATATSAAPTVTAPSTARPCLLCPRPPS